MKAVLPELDVVELGRVRLGRRRLGDGAENGRARGAEQRRRGPSVPAAARRGIGGTGGTGADVGMGGAAGEEARAGLWCGRHRRHRRHRWLGCGRRRIAVAGGNKLAPDIGSGTAGCIVIPPATGGGGSGRSSAGPSVANASIGVWVRVSVYWQRTGSNLRGRQPSAE